MNIVVNGSYRTIDEGATISGLLASVGIRPGVTVVERNGLVQERREFETTRLAEGDVVEIVRFVGGG